jgi:hypothetical protein
MASTVYLPIFPPNKSPSPIPKQTVFTCLSLHLPIITFPHLNHHSPPSQPSPFSLIIILTRLLLMCSLSLDFTTAFIPHLLSLSRFTPRRPHRGRRGDVTASRGQVVADADIHFRFYDMAAPDDLIHRKDRHDTDETGTEACHKNEGECSVKCVCVLCRCCGEMCIGEVMVPRGVVMTE